VGQHGGGGGAVAGSIIGFGGGLTDQGDAGVFNVVLQFNFLGDGYAVIDDLGGAELLLKHHIATLRAKGDSHGFGQDVHAPFEGPAGLLVINNALGHGW